MLPSVVWATLASNWTRGEVHGNLQSIASGQKHRWQMVSKGRLLFSHSIMSNSLWPHGLQHAKLPWPSLSPGVCSNSCPLTWWCHPTWNVHVDSIRVDLNCRTKAGVLRISSCWCGQCPSHIHTNTYTLKLFSEHLSTLKSLVSQILKVDSESQDEECEELPVKEYKPSSWLSEKDPNASLAEGTLKDLFGHITFLFESLSIQGLPFNLTELQFQ